MSAGEGMQPARVSAPSLQLHLLRAYSPQAISTPHFVRNGFGCYSAGKLSQKSTVRGRCIRNQSVDCTAGFTVPRVFDVFRRPVRKQTAFAQPRPRVSPDYRLPEHRTQHLNACNPDKRRCMLQLHYRVRFAHPSHSARAYRPTGVHFRTNSSPMTMEDARTPPSAASASASAKKKRKPRIASVLTSRQVLTSLVLQPPILTRLAHVPQACSFYEVEVPGIGFATECIPTQHASETEEIAMMAAAGTVGALACVLRIFFGPKEQELSQSNE